MNRLWFIVAYFALCTSAFAFTPWLTGPGITGGGNVPFTALHTYFIAPASASPAGNDLNAGTLAAPWLTVNGHSIKCGDVVIAVAGSYPAMAITSSPSSCPSPSGTGGINNSGNIYFAVLLCAGPNLGACTATTSGSNVIAVSVGPGTSGPPANNWAVEGFSATAGTFGQAFSANGCQTSGFSIEHHTAFINNIAHDSGYGFNQSPCASGLSNDYVAVVGNAVINANGWTGGAGTCGGAIDFNSPANFDTNAGTHLAIIGNYEGGNIGPTPVTDCTSDTEAIILDTLGTKGYSQAIEVQDNLTWDTGGYTFQIFYNSSGGGAIPILANHNTFFAGCSNFPEGTTNCSEFNIQTGVSSPWLVTLTNNIARTNAATTSGGGQIYDLNYVELSTAVSSQYTTTNNVFYGTAPVSNCEHSSGIGCQPTTGPYSMAISCCSTTPALPPPLPTTPNLTVYSDPLFANAADALANWVTNPTSKCSSYSNVAACMGWNFSTQTATALTPIADLTATASGLGGAGYRPPGPCAADANFPTWLNGIVYLHWNGASITENADLVNKPCNL